MLTWWHDDNYIIADLADLDDPDEPDDLGDQEEVKDLKYYCYYLINLKYRSKSFKEGGESFVLVAVVTDVSQDVTEGEEGGVRHMWVSGPILPFFSSRMKLNYTLSSWLPHQYIKPCIFTQVL